jgi:tetratricopeptide (TPR) repeat protein
MNTIGEAKRPKVESDETPAPAPVAVRKNDDPGCKSCIASAAAMFAQGKNLEAASLLSKWSGRCPNSTQLHLMLSTILIRTGDKTGAESESELAVQTAPSSVAAHLQYGLAAMLNKHNMQAKEEFARVTELDPASYEGWSSLSMVAKELHDDAEAAAAAKKAADLEPNSKTVRMGTLLNLKRAGKFSEAKTELKRLLANNTSPEFAEELAREAMMVGAFDEAIEACQRVASTYPKATTPLLMLALAHYCVADYSASSDDADKILSLDSQNADGAAIKALACTKQNKLDEADQSLKSINASQSSSSIVLLSQGSLNLARGSYADSETMLQSCLDADASNISLQGLPHSLAHMALGELYTKTGKTALADEESKALAKDKRFRH